MIARIAPEATVIDLTHGIRPPRVRQGAAVLANALPFAPPGVHLAVVDPEVGTERRAVAVRVADEDRVLVGPDNGLLWPAIERLGGAVEAVDVSLSPLPARADLGDLPRPRRLRPGRGARSRRARPLAEAGEQIPAGCRWPPSRRASRRSDRTASLAHVVYLDRLRERGARPRPISTCPRPRPAARPLGGDRDAQGQRHEAVFALTFADVGEGELLLYVDSYGSLALAVNRGSAAAELGLAPGDEVVLRPA